MANVLADVRSGQIPSTNQLCVLLSSLWKCRQLFEAPNLTKIDTLPMMIIMIITFGIWRRENWYVVTFRGTFLHRFQCEVVDVGPFKRLAAENFILSGHDAASLCNSVLNFVLSGNDASVLNFVLLGNDGASLYNSLLNFVLSENDVGSLCNSVLNFWRQIHSSNISKSTTQWCSALSQNGYPKHTAVETGHEGP